MHGHHGSTVEADAHTDTRPWTAMAIALVAQVLVVVDISVVNTAMPSIARDLHLGSSDSSGSSPPTCCSPAAVSCSAGGSPTSSRAPGCSSSG